MGEVSANLRTLIYRHQDAAIPTTAAVRRPYWPDGSETGFPMKIVTSSASALVFCAGLVGAAHAAQTQIDLSSLTNEDIQTYTNGTNYPLAGSTVNITGANGVVSVTLSSFEGAANTTG